MTAIAGLVHDGRVHIAGDSAGVAGWDLTVRADSKVFINGPYVFGFTSSFRMGQLIQHAFAPPTPDGGDVHKFMVTTFIDALRECLKEGGWAKKDSEREQAGTFLVGIHGRLFVIDSDYQVGEPADGFAAVGCGDNQALGVLYATRSHKDPHQRLMTALAAAERFSAGVRGPFNYVVEPERTTGNPDTEIAELAKVVHGLGEVFASDGEGRDIAAALHAAGYRKAADMEGGA